MLVITAFKTLPEFTKDAMSLPTSISLDNFVEAWNKASFPRYLLNTVIYTASSTIVFVVSGTFLALAIARRFVRGSGGLFTLFLIALFLPAALIPQFQLILALGLYNNPIGYVMLFVVNPIGIVILVNYIRTIPIELDEAAAIEGCGYLRYVLRIILPLASPAIATVAVLHAIGVWNELVLATIYLTSESYYPITRGLIVFNGVYGNNWPLLAAAVLMMTLPMVVFFVLAQRWIIGGVTAGAVKG
jgi:raffinose/stachyose/melibiose transport system permease protein